MKRNHALKVFLILVLPAFLAVSCGYGIHEGFYRENPVGVRAGAMTFLSDTATSGLVSSISGKKYKLLVISDVHQGKNEDSASNAAKFTSWVFSESQKPDFCINLGDTADHGNPSEIDSYVEMEDYIKTLGVKNVYNLPGNHDLYNSGWNYWKERMYPHESFYTFSTGALSFYFIDSASGSLGNAQMNSLRTAMENDGKQKIVLSHYPVLSNELMGYCSIQDSYERDLLVDMFVKNKVRYVIAGHSHVYEELEAGTFKEINAPSLGKDGRFLLFTIDESDMSIKCRIVSP